MSKRLHFIAIGGAAMHNLALALQQNGYRISGSDDEILEPSRSRLENTGLLPPEQGWFPDKIDKTLDGVVLGMHARKDNPELLRALEKNIPVFSFPEFLYEHSKNKKRVVIGGSHGKTTITSMILHVLRNLNFNFDYMVGAKIDGFETMVRLSDAPLIILEGDEYLSSPIDLRPKFHLYKADIALISGIAWDHINVFPTFENYLDQFRIFADAVPNGGELIYCSGDTEVNSIALNSTTQARKISYTVPDHSIVNGNTFLHTAFGDYRISVFGEHNLMNLEGARLVCKSLGVDDQSFYETITNFKGASRRLELLAKTDTVSIFRDFAHSPSKLKATIHAVRQQFPDRKLVACMELHTFSSLNENFLNQYSGTMDEADIPLVFFNPLTIEHKKLKPLSIESVVRAFGNEQVQVYTDSFQMKKMLLSLKADNLVVLLMSSGNFNNLDVTELAKELAGEKSLHRTI